MAHDINISHLNTFRMVPKDNTKPERHKSGHLDTEWQSNMIKPGQDHRYYLQKMERHLPFRFMVSLSPVTSVTLTILDINQTVVKTITSPLDYDVPGRLDSDGDQMTTYLYKLPNYDDIAVDGVYVVALTVVWPDTSITEKVSDPFILKDAHPGTILLEYRHTTNKDDVPFEQLPVIWRFLVEGVITGLDPAFVDTMYDDDGNVPVLLDSDSYDVWEFHVGHGERRGIPEWVLKKLSKILTCNRVQFDGKQYLKVDGADWQKTAGSPLFGATISLRDPESGGVHVDYGDNLNLYTAPSYPYAVGVVIIDGMLIYSGAEIADGTAETTFIAALNTALGDTELSGSIEKSGSVVRYVNAAGERYNSATVSLYTSYFNFSFQPSGADTLEFYLRNADVLINWGDGTLEIEGAFGVPILYTHSYTGAGIYPVKIWGSTELFSIDDTDVSGLTGTIPSDLKVLDVQNVTFPSNTFNFSFLAPAAAELTTLFLPSNGLTAANGMQSYNFPKLISVNFSGNSFNQTVMSAMVLDVKLNAFANAIYNGSLNVAFQTTGASLNASGNFNKSQLILNGWSVQP